ncbi:flavin-containing monooxygenase [Nocardia sp. NPDC055029]
MAVGTGKRSAGGSREARSSSVAEAQEMPWQDEVEAVVVGAGMSGVALTRALKQQGLREIMVLERGDQLGGTWHHNRYPGVACDVPSAAYSFSWAPNDWTRLFAGGDEIREYLQRVAAEHDIERHVRLKTELLEAAWDVETSRWVIETTRGRVRSQFLVLATGQLHDAIVPATPGADKFAGTTFHSMYWPEDFDAAGKRIAVVGTGASAIQFVPQIQPDAERLVVLQRTPPWIVQKFDMVHKKVDAERAMRRQRRVRKLVLSILEVFLGVTSDARRAFLIEWMARKHLRDSVADPALRAALTPDYKINCKRILQSNEWYPAIQGTNVDFVTSGLKEIREHSVVTSDGQEFEVDTIIYGTGFQLLQDHLLKRVRGRDGRIMSEVFAGKQRAYKATTMVGCPNMFVILGPNGGAASIPVAIEAQARYVSSAIETMRRRGLESFEVRPAAEEAWNRTKDAHLENSVWNAGGCSNYYVTDGVNNVVWPGSMGHMKKALHTFDLENYVVTQKSDLRPAKGESA